MQKKLNTLNIYKENPILFDCVSNMAKRNITNKVRLCELREPQSEPFVGQARIYIGKSFFG
jgi:hypothetical protein